MSILTKIITNCIEPHYSTCVTSAIDPRGLVKMHIMNLCIQEDRVDILLLRLRILSAKYTDYPGHYIYKKHKTLKDGGRETG